VQLKHEKTSNLTLERSNSLSNYPETSLSLKWTQFTNRCYPRYNDATVTAQNRSQMWQKPSTPSPILPRNSSYLHISTSSSPTTSSSFQSSFKMSMKAVVYQKPFTLKVEQVPKPKIEHPDDIIVKITTSAICGSDLHMYVYPPLQGFVTFVGRSYSCWTRFDFRTREFRDCSGNGWWSGTFKERW